MKLRSILVASAAALALAACNKAPEPAPVAATPAAETPPPVKLAAADPMNGDGGVPAFYSDAPATPELVAKPGQLVRKEKLPDDFSLSNAGGADRIIYSSTNGVDGKSPIIVSGAVFLPKGEKPADGWPVIAWAHGTVGMADICAPSNNKRSQRDTDYLNHWLAQGYAVVASDYQGLGVPGPHPYLATRPEAWSVLDAVRAAEGDKDYGLSKKVVLVGQSQGGGAAFATAVEASSYAPDVDIRGTVATGTPYFTTTTAPATRDPNAVEGVFAYSLYILQLVGQVDPDFKPDDIITDTAKPVFDLTRTACLGALEKAIVDNKISQAVAFKSDPTPTTAKYYGLMAYSSLMPKGPVFMGTGGKDHDVPPPGQQRLFEDACKAGAVIERHVYADLDHSGTVNGSLKDSTPFVKKAFAGEAIAGNCPKAK
jgi:pimeloyl-ACP methyl ester carboxylesterase